MAAVRPLLRQLLRAAEDSARLALGGGFRAAGVTFQHPGVLLDQQRAAEVVARVREALALRRRHPPRSVDGLLSRVDVRVLPAREAQAARVDLDARWTGGLRDRGRILMRLSDDWPERLGRALLALLLVELEPETSPDEVPLAVTDEAS